MTRITDWIKKLTIPKKSGKGYFLLGDQESKSRIKAFSTVGTDTQEILKLLKDAGIEFEFQCVPGNHYDDGIPRRYKAFVTLYSDNLRK